MATVRDLIGGALRLIGVGAEGETLTAQAYVDGLAALNSMLDEWSAQKLSVYTINRQVQALTIGKASYTLGTGGEINVERPTFIENASVLLTSMTPNIEIPIAMWSDEDWRDVTIKTLSSTYPVGIYNDGNYPLSNVYVWPIPTAACSLVLYLPGILTRYTSLASDLALPKGYERALRYNLACELAPEYGREPSPTVARNAMVSKSNLEARNWTPQLMRVERAFQQNNQIGTMAIKSQGFVVD